MKKMKKYCYQVTKAIAKRDQVPQSERNKNVYIVFQCPTVPALQVI
jgi:hypothetical protein